MTIHTLQKAVLTLAVGGFACGALAQHDGRDHRAAHNTGDRAPAPEQTTDKAGDAQVILETWDETRPLTRPAKSQPPGQGGIAGVPTNEFFSVNHDPEGDWPSDLAYTPDGAQVLITHRLTDNVVFFDTATGTATSTVDVGEYPLTIAVTPDGQHAVTADVFSNTVSIINIATATKIADVPVTGNQPYRVKATPDGTRVVVGVINDGINSAFSVVDIASQQEILNFPSGGQGQYGGWFTPESGAQGPTVTNFELTPDGNWIVQPYRSGAEVRIYEVATGDLVESFATALNPTRVHISPDGELALVQHDANGNGVTLIDLTTLTAGPFWPVTGISGRPALLTPDKNFAVTGSGNNLIFVNLNTGAVETSHFTGAVFDLALSHDGQYAVMPGFNARVVDIETQSIVATLTLAAGAEIRTSPAGLKAVALNNRFREDILFYDINGEDGFVEGFASTGVPPEADAPRNIAMSADGSVAVVTNQTSRNAAIVEFTGSAQSVRSYVEVGERPLDVAITPDGQYAVVAATDEHMVQVIDLATDTVVSSLPISQRPIRVRISADSQRAYVLNTAAGDKLSFIHLDGANSSIVTQVATGSTGSHQSPTYTEFSGIELSPDGSLLAVCVSFEHLVRFYDTSTFDEVAAVPTGTFPIRVVFSPDGTRAYAANHNGHSVTVIDVDGANSSAIATIPEITRALFLAVDAAGEYLYVGNTAIGAAPKLLYVIDTATNAVVTSIPLVSNVRAGHYVASEGRLYIATADPGRLIVIDAAGPDTAIIEEFELTNGPSDMVFNEPTQTAVFTQPIPDGLDIVRFGEPAPSCPADLTGDNSVGVPDLLALLAAWGPCPSPCPADLTGNDNVGVPDLLDLLAQWGPCP